MSANWEVGEGGGGGSAAPTTHEQRLFVAWAHPKCLSALDREISQATTTVLGNCCV